MNRKMPVWATLCIVCLCAALVLTLVNRLTVQGIADQEARLEAAPRAAALAAATRFEALEPRQSRYGLDSLYAGMNDSGEVVGYVGRTTVTGYGGPVEVVAGLDLNGDVTGVSVGGESFAETPGLGELTREAAFTSQFAGKTPPFALGEGGVDTVSGASTTSRAVVSGVNNVAAHIRTCILGLDQEQEQVYTGTTWSASAKGFGGEVTANVGFAGDGSVEYLAIDTPNETDGLGKLASERAFTGQFIGKTGPFVYGEDGIEALTGATYTSQAALDAINAVVAGNGAASDAPVTASAKGYGGEVTVTARLNADNTIAALTIDAPNETDGLGKRAEEPEFAAQFIGRAAPFAYGEDGIEALTGATVTSTAVLEALNSAVPAAEGGAASAAALADGAGPAAPDAGDAQGDIGEPAPEMTGASRGDIEKYLRPRPVFGEAEAAIGKSDEGAADTAAVVDIGKYLRPRPAFGDAKNGEQQSEETEVDIERYLRPRPVFGDAEAAIGNADESAADTAVAVDIERYLRPRPVFGEAEAAIGKSDEGAAETSAAVDIGRYLRPRPAFGDAEAAIGNADESAAETAAVVDIGKYLRPRPVFGDAVNEEDKPEETEVDISRYLRPRPAFAG